MNSLKKIIQDIWEGDVSYEEATQNFSTAQIKDMNKVIKDNLNVFKPGEGVPFPEDDANYKLLLDTNAAARNIQKIIDMFEDNSPFHRIRL